MARTLGRANTSVLNSSEDKELLDVISSVKTRIQDKLGTVNFQIPEFIIVGGQSTGKSRLIETLAGEQFNFICGSLGSRRPTRLEFRNDPKLADARWYVLEEGKFKPYSQAQVMEILKNSHESLGMSVSTEEVTVKLESPTCIDMQVVDLPGFRKFADTPDKQKLQSDIDRMNRGFMQNENCVMLCVEQAGDASTYSTLQVCREYDPNYRRTILVRSKFDKYYHDLSPSPGVDRWVKGEGDLPDSLVTFALSMPHWSDGEGIPQGITFVGMREQSNVADLEQVRALNIQSENLAKVGYENFSRFMSKKIKEMFASAVLPVIKQMSDLQSKLETDRRKLLEEKKSIDPAVLEETVKSVARTFGDTLASVLEGDVGNEGGKTLEQELEEFAQFCQDFGITTVDVSPSPEIGQKEYVEYLTGEDDAGFKAIADAGYELFGGAQYKRLIAEVEIYIRFAELPKQIEAQDVVQARGVSMNSITWKDVVVKLLSHEAHINTKHRVQYVSERLGWFFREQKTYIMMSLERRAQSDRDGLASKCHTLLTGNAEIRQLVFDAYDGVVARQMKNFIQLYEKTIGSTFSNPWAFLKKQSLDVNEDRLRQMEKLPTFADSQKRIPQELRGRGALEMKLGQWCAEIPANEAKIDEAVEKVEQLVYTIFAFIRAQVSDQVELFVDSFFKVPMLRTLGDAMVRIGISPEGRKRYEERTEEIEAEVKILDGQIDELKECLHQLKDFASRNNMR
mmetsp:Transcript_18382/g.44294  ORF Transcript_18382/g.44294 Transcript_18382/m.44294 type:complete len:737 (-) Transcript_18382:271-2481(-)